MRAKDFRQFLVRTYRGPLSDRPLSDAAAGDAVSRCRRVEAALEADLDTLLRNRSLEDVLVLLSRAKIRFEGSADFGSADLRSALRKYASFVGKVARPRAAWRGTKTAHKQR